MAQPSLVPTSLDIDFLMKLRHTGGVSGAESTGPLRLVVIEDHPLVRDALVAAVQSVSTGAILIHKGGDIELALDSISQFGADIVLLDLDLGTGKAPVETLRRVLDREVPVLIVSALGSPSVVRACLSAGAIGFVSKQAEREQLADAIAAALQRRTYTSPEVTAMLMSTEEQTAVKLSPQEERAAILYASGMKLATVARAMGISEYTTQEYINRVRDKYDAAGRASRTKTDLYRVVREDGLLP